MAQQGQVCNVVVEQDGKYLLVQEAKPKAYKLWNLLGGLADSGETLQEAAAREAYEETNYSVTVLKKLVVIERPQDGVVLQAYLARIDGGSLRWPPNEIMDAQWFSYEEIMAKQDLRDPEYIIKAVQAAHA